MSVRSSEHVGVGGVYTAFDLGWIWAGEEGGLEHAGERGSTLLLTWWDEFE